MTFARLLLELQKRGPAGLVNAKDLSEAMDELAELAERHDSTEAVAVRYILAAAIGAYRELTLEGRAIDSLTPPTVWRLDAILTALVDGTLSREELRNAVRSALIRPAH